MKRILLTLLAVLTLVLVQVVPAMAATTQEVTITATPTYIALTNSENAWAIGAVTADTIYWWTTDGNIPDPASPMEAADMKSTITNTGSVAEDIDIKVAAFTGGVGWAISTDDTPGADEVSLQAGITGGNAAALTQVITTDSELVDSLASSGTMKWCMRLKTASSFGDGVAKSGTVTLTASVAD